MPPASSRVRGNGLAGLLLENVDAAANARPFAHHRGLGQLLLFTVLSFMRAPQQSIVTSQRAVPVPVTVVLLL